MNGKPVFTVPAKSIINFKSGFAHKLLCDGPTFSTGTSCVYDCAFCYVPAAMRKQTEWLQNNGVHGKHEDIVVRRASPIQLVRAQLLSSRGDPKFNDPNDRRTIYASPLVDVAGNMELVRETVEICKEILTLTNWQIRLLSKSNLLPKVAQLLEEWDDWRMCGFKAWERSKARVVYGVSTGTLDDGLAKAFEEGTPLVSKRIESLHWLQDNGYRTFAMVCPSLPMADDMAYRRFACEAAAKLRYDRCEHVWAEVLNARGESFKRTYEALLLAGYAAEAGRFKTVTENRTAWEAYARDTFLAHRNVAPEGKLRFLQYVNNDNREWWERFKESGAILL